MPLTAGSRVRADGGELFYSRGTTIDAVSVQIGWDVSPDGQWFVVDLIKKPSGQLPITVIANWPARLNR